MNFGLFPVLVPIQDMKGIGYPNLVKFREKRDCSQLGHDKGCSGKFREKRDCSQLGHD